MLLNTNDILAYIQRIPAIQRLRGTNSPKNFLVIKSCMNTHGSLTEKRRVALHNLFQGMASKQKSNIEVFFVTFQKIMFDIGLLQN